MIRIDPDNPRAVELGAALDTLLDAAALPPDLTVVLGGDGWMLSCVREGGPGQTYLGLNAGHLGFLLNDVKGDLAGAAEAVRAGRYTAWSFPRLQLTAWAPDGASLQAVAVNDVYVERSTGHTMKLRLTIDGVPVVESLATDGLIVATALGSTAYSFSAGGVPCHPLVRAFQVTPICPHTPRLSSFSVPEEAEIEVLVLEPEQRPARVVSDGVDHGRIARMRVTRATPDVRLAFLAGHNMTGTLVRKILHA